MSKDQAIGGVIFLVCLIVVIGYSITLAFPQITVDLLNNVGVHTNTADTQFWAVAIPVFIAFIAVLFIGAWIGWTMATTPPPKPIEEITSEIEETKATK